MYKAIIFDLDDTLYDYETIHSHAMEILCNFTCQKFGISRALFFEAFDWAKSETKKCLGNTGASHNRILYCQKALEYIGARPAEGALEMYETYWGYMLEHMRLREGAGQLLEYCRSNRIKIGICSDLTAHIQHRKINQLGISGFVDAIVTSEEAGAEKPAEVMYRMILDKLKANPQDAVFVGDSLKKDVKGPMRVGMKALWFHDGEDAGYPSVSSFAEVRFFLNGC